MNWAAKRLANTRDASPEDDDWPFCSGHELFDSPQPYCGPSYCTLNLFRNSARQAGMEATEGAYRQAYRGVVEAERRAQHGLPWSQSTAAISMSLLKRGRRTSVPVRPSVPDPSQPPGVVDPMAAITSFPDIPVASNLTTESPPFCRRQRVLRHNPAATTKAASTPVAPTSKRCSGRKIISTRTAQMKIITAQVSQGNPHIRNSGILPSRDD